MKRNSLINALVLFVWHIPTMAMCGLLMLTLPLVFIGKFVAPRQTDAYIDAVLAWLDERTAKMEAAAEKLRLDLPKKD